MELLNATGMQAGYTMGMDVDGRERLVVVIKGTYNLAENGEVITLAEQQLPLVEADQFSGEPGLSAPVYESDYAPYKPRCDVLLNGTAWAPGGKAVRKLEVGLRAGPIDKSFTVLGNRHWSRKAMLLLASLPEYFHTQPISYDYAWGGTDNTHVNEARHAACLENPVGRGFWKNSDVVNQQPLPNTEASGEPVDSPKGHYQPMAFGPVGRAWKPRYQFAGTYDDNWFENIFPFLPPDFDPQYFQSAPPDQQMPWPQGGEQIELINLTPSGRCRFRLPDTRLPVEFSRVDYSKEHCDAKLDTIFIESDQKRVQLVWRTSLPLKKDMFEITQVVIGTMSRGWYQARRTGKQYYRSIDLLARERQQTEQEDA